MNLTNIDGRKLKKFILSGANRLNENKDYVDSLNVFPVPDGDTGTNMSLTVLAAAKEVSEVESNNVTDIAKALSRGSLRGARGNSGVILSQLFRGFSKSLEGKETASTKDIAEAFSNGVDSAYKAVMKPKEGTILTVSRAISDKALEVSENSEDLLKMMEEVINHANVVLDKTVNMLPELKQANVVDAGGKGLISILEGGFFDKHNYHSLNIDNSSSSANNISNTTNAQSYTSSDDIEFGYCTEFFINLENNEQIEEDFKEFLSTIGDSVVTAGDDDFIKVHVHTNNPGAVLEKALTLGSIDNVKIENMRTQHNNLIEFSTQEISNNNAQKVKEEEKEFGFVAVSVGDGVNEMFKEYGVDQIITGGQTMNPSIEDILLAVEKINAKNVFVLPNNKNIILAANQAKEVFTTKNIVVIESVSITQGFSALTSFVSTSSLEENTSAMKSAIESVITGQVTFAVRDTKIDNFNIKKNHILCMLENKINNVSESILEGTKELIGAMLPKNDDASIISIYYGDDISEDNACELESYLQETYKDLDIELIYGGQPLYYYIISIE
ncbi:MAG: DAK2 domain-containing protein [bacterium]